MSQLRASRVRAWWCALPVLLLLVLSGAAPVPVDGGPAVAAVDPTEPSGSTTWALRPASQDGPDGRVSMRHVVEGGAEAADLVALTNFGDRPATFAVYASDGTVAPDGSFDVLPSDELPLDGGAWVTVGPGEGSVPREAGGIVLEVAAGATVVLPVLIRVPENATPGDHPAGVVAELVQSGGGGVQLTSRVGVRLHLRVGGDVVASLVPESVTATYTPSWNPFAQGTVTVTYTLVNEGNVRLGADVVTSLAGPRGLAQARTAGEHREVLPGGAAQTTVEVTVTPLFRAWGEVVVTPTVVGDDDVAAALDAASTSFTVWTVPWSQLALLLVLVGASLAGRWLRRRSAARVQARIDAAVAAARAADAAPVPAAAGRAPTEG